MAAGRHYNGSSKNPHLTSPKKKKASSVISWLEAGGRFSMHSKLFTDYIGICTGKKSVSVKNTHELLKEKMQIPPWFGLFRRSTS